VIDASPAVDAVTEEILDRLCLIQGERTRGAVRSLHVSEV
jgi:hypothetical protein